MGKERITKGNDKTQVYGTQDEINLFNTTPGEIPGKEESKQEKVIGPKSHYQLEEGNLDNAIDEAERMGIISSSSSQAIKEQKKVKPQRNGQ